MAKCGCSSSTVCPCVLSAGSNVTISGTGQASDPWVINAATNPVTVTDTPTVDLTLIGQDIQAAVNLDPVAGNLITTTAQGLRVALTAGDGIDAAQLAAGTVAACLSTDANNALSFGADGCLYAPVAGGSSVVTADTATVNLSAGTSPLTADVIVAPGAGQILTSTASGLLADIITGCGLSGQGNAASPLVVDTNGAVWPWTCTEASGGGKVYCDPVTFGLVTDPEKFFLVEHLVQPATGGPSGSGKALIDWTTLNGGNVVPNVNTLFTQSVTGDLVFTNPSPCRRMQLNIEFGLHHFALRIDGPGRTNVFVTAALSAAGAGGVAFGTQTVNAHNQFLSANPDNGDDFVFDTPAYNLLDGTFILNPGGSVTFTIGSQMKIPNFANNGQNSALNYDTFVRVTGWSL